MKALGLICSTLVLSVLFLFVASCGSSQELSPEEIAFQKKAGENALLAKTVRKVRTGEFEKGRPGGVWYDDISGDPKSFNKLLETDAETALVVGVLSDSLLDYDLLTRAWKPNLASYEIKTDKDKNTLEMHFTLRDDLYWTSLAEPGKKVPVTSDDVVFWYNEISGDPALQQSAYAQQFQTMPDGTEKRVTMEKIDERRFVMKFPQIEASPELACNMDFGPRYIYEPLKKQGGVDALMKLWSIDTDPKTIPSCGPYYIESYRPGIEVVQVKNPHYWKKDTWGQSIPYIEKIVLRIISNAETIKLKFLAGEIDSYTLRPEDLEEFTKKENPDYTVYYVGPALSSGFIGWNQNPKNLDKKYVSWFSKREFRQAMSHFLNRERIVDNVYRGLGSANLGFFPKVNPFYNPEITQKFTYDPAKGKALLSTLGIRPDTKGIMRDADGNAIEFDLSLGLSNTVAINIANVYADELKQMGILMRVRPVEAQKLWESIDKSYNWHAAMFSFGAARFPSQGSNVWQSSGNLHFWNPLQPKPATEWEARLDELYRKGNVTIDKVEAKKIWDEYQQLILDEMPVVYLIRPDSFAAYRNKWGNVYPDTAVSADPNYFYLKN